MGLGLVGFTDAFNTIRLYKHPAKGMYSEAPNRRPPPV